MGIVSAVSCECGEYDELCVVSVVGVVCAVSVVCCGGAVCVVNVVCCV